MPRAHVQRGNGASHHSSARSPSLMFPQQLPRAQCRAAGARQLPGECKHHLHLTAIQRTGERLEPLSLPCKLSKCSGCCMCVGRASFEGWPRPCLYRHMNRRAAVHQFKLNVAARGNSLVGRSPRSTQAATLFHTHVPIRQVETEPSIPPTVPRSFPLLHHQRIGKRRTGHCVRGRPVSIFQLRPL